MLKKYGKEALDDSYEESEESPIIHNRNETNFKKY
jgi:hypothetical protein